ncbi:caspase family protein [Dactylosporangium darangshiense]|uniref:caspase family protein n=1 Tax=Dactylosporangium darangshiense TaxID=579108 RepID=UPI00363714B5
MSASPARASRAAGIGAATAGPAQARRRTPSAAADAGSAGRMIRSSSWSVAAVDHTVPGRRPSGSSVSTLYALLVGIDRYRSPSVPALAGCANDVADARSLLEHRRAPGTDLHVRRLLNDEATRSAIVAGFRTHLARARAGDTALFWFSGHGSAVPVPDALWHLEPTGLLQTLVCADSRTDDHPDLLDKELAVLLDEVAERGAHVVAVLDCCHSGGASRGPEGLRLRTAAPRTLPHERFLLPGLWQRYRQGVPEPRALTLAACRATEQARERRLDGRDRGLFSWSLTAALRRCPPATTYRDLLAVARGEVERWSVAQRPELIPTGPGPADQPFLGGRIAPAAGLTMREGRDGWEVNAGLCHGVPAVAGDPARFAVDGPPPVREAEARRVLTGRTVVTPLGWAPDPGRTYRAALSRVPAPATTVAVDDGVPALPAGPSAHIRFVRAAEPAELRVRPSRTARSASSTPRAGRCTARPTRAAWWRRWSTSRAGDRSATCATRCPASPARSASSWWSRIRARRARRRTARA